MSAPRSVTSAELSFVRSVTVWIWPRSICSRNPLKDFAGTRSEFEISFEAKNASTITIRIGNAALLKNLLIGYRRAARTQGWNSWTR